MDAKFKLLAGCIEKNVGEFPGLGLSGREVLMEHLLAPEPNVLSVLTHL
jgi:hypothetical protein